MAKIEKGSPLYKMFNEYYKLIQLYDTPKDADELLKIKHDLEDWAVSLPQEAQVLGLCLGHAFFKYSHYIARGYDELSVFKNDKGEIGIRGFKS